MVLFANLLYSKRHITESDNDYVPYCFLQCCFFTVPYRFTLFSNIKGYAMYTYKVLLPYKFTLFSNLCNEIKSLFAVLLPYRFTLFSNQALSARKVNVVLLPYRFTLFSNDYITGMAQAYMFYYLIDSHYSQTRNLFCITKQ